MYLYIYTYIYVLYIYIYIYVQHTLAQTRTKLHKTAHHTTTSIVWSLQVTDEVAPKFRDLREFLAVSQGDNEAVDAAAAVAAASGCQSFQ